MEFSMQAHSLVRGSKEAVFLWAGGSGMQAGHEGMPGRYSKSKLLPAGIAGVLPFILCLLLSLW